MPAATRNRVSAPAAVPVNKPATSAQKGIQKFARVSKAALALSESKKRKATSQEIDREVQPAEQSSRKKQLLQRPTLQNPAETPTRGASRLLANLDLSKPIKPLKLAPIAETPSPAKNIPSTSSSPAKTSTTKAPKAEDEEDAELPDEIQQLISLHSSFLTALSLQYAHNGTATPVDIRTLTPSVTKIWGKRKVTLDDIKRSIGIMAHGNTKGQTGIFNLSDYGRGKVCLELHQTQKRSKRSSGALAQPINEKEMNASFVAEVNRHWSEWRADVTAKNDNTQSVRNFISQLPLADVTECASLTKVAPLLAKGQRRLEDLKAGAIKAQKGSILAAQKGEEKENAHPSTLAPSAAPVASDTRESSPTDPDSLSDKENTPAPASPARPAPAPAASRATSLLDRILAKQQAASLLPAAPSASQRARQAALQRCEEVLAVLTLMAASGAAGATTLRTSFPLARLVRDVQGSSGRAPIAADEVRRVVEVLAEDIAPGYVKVVRAAGLEAVVVDRARVVGAAEVRRRLVDAGMRGDF